MRLIALDTSTEYCSVAYLNGEQIRSRAAHAPRQHTQLILNYVEALLAESEHSLSQLDGIVIGQGPGSFTGVRIAASMGQGLAFSQDIPVVGVSSLQALAQQLYRRFKVSHCLATLDARMGELYVGAYRVEPATIPPELNLTELNQVATLLGEERTLKPEQVWPWYQTEQNQKALGEDEDCLVVGSGLLVYPELGAPFMNQVSSTRLEELKQLYPQAQDMLPLGYQTFVKGEESAAESFTINYVRNEVAWQKQP